MTVELYIIKVKGEDEIYLVPWGSLGNPDGLWTRRRSFESDRDYLGSMIR